MGKHCSFCNCEETLTSTLMNEGYYEDIFLCHDCWFSEKVKNWRKEKELCDPDYKNYCERISTGFKINCKSCGLETNRNPKFIGHSPRWEVCCDQCSEVDYNFVSPYKYNLEKWLDIYSLYMRGKYNIEENWEELCEMDKELNLPIKKCNCGGTFSMLSKPRCKNCKKVVSESIFHVCNEYYS